MEAKPVSIDFNREKQLLTIVWSDNNTFEYSSEFLRVYSPSAEVRGHGQGQETLQVGKKDVAIKDLKPAGRYALKITFDDGHDSGIYDWRYLYRIGAKHDLYWQDYLKRLKEAGAQREANFINITQLN
jgi:DUF971 family protein